MSFGDLLGQIMQQGLGAGSPTRGRLETAGQNLDQPAGGLGGLFEQLQGALGGALGGGTASGGGFADRAQDFLRQDQVGNLSGAQVGGIGALAGALLGGGLGGAAKGGAMAVLGTLALSALKRAQGGGAGADQVQATPDELRAVSSPDTERLLLRAMISAAKADGQIDQAEMQKVVGALARDTVTPEEKQFVLDQMAGPVDVEALAAEVRSRAQAAEVYAASLMAINADTDAERAYLAALARALKLDDAAVAELHRLTGAPATA
ncbi:MAG TPA: DUF533 domain-containing protein [Amaricoccus sp.]|nr:DUF533 domain-containing protein [Amaricoccus sp.]